MVTKWAALASQTKPGAAGEQATSILSYNLEIIVEASNDLDKILGDHLDMVLGKGITPSPPTTITNKYNTVASSEQGNTSGGNAELMKDLKEAANQSPS